MQRSISFVLLVSMLLIAPFSHAGETEDFEKAARAYENQQREKAQLAERASDNRYFRQEASAYFARERGLRVVGFKTVDWNDSGVSVVKTIATLNNGDRCLTEYYCSENAVTCMRSGKVTYYVAGSASHCSQPY
jgi:hypothetical protein